MIRSARSEDVPRLREVAYAAKLHWGYDEQLVRSWSDGLDLPAEAVQWVAEEDGRVVGWAAILPPEDGVCLLDDLWVDPAAMGHGAGRSLFDTAAGRARELGARALEWAADPHAVGFYEHVGAQVVDDHVSEWGREIPWMRLEL